MSDIQSKAESRNHATIRVMKRSFSVNSYIHIIKRGVRGLPIVKDDHDKWRFLRSLRYFNDDKSHSHWHSEAKAAGAEGHTMPWPEEWADQNKLVNIYAYTLMPNHFHLVLEANQKNGVGTFMKKVSESMTKYYNRKYDEEGSLFQSTYTSSVINTDRYLRFVFAYVLVKNVFELYPQGFSTACANFDAAIDWAGTYPFSSLANQLGRRKNSPIITNNSNLQLFTDPSDFKRVAKESLRYSEAKKLDNTDIILE